MVYLKQSWRCIFEYLVSLVKYLNDVSFEPGQWLPPSADFTYIAQLNRLLKLINLYPVWVIFFLKQNNC